MSEVNYMEVGDITRKLENLLSLHTGHACKLKWISVNGLAIFLRNGLLQTFVKFPLKGSGVKR